MKTYNSFNEIEVELKQLDLKRKITFEEIKLLKNDVKENLQPNSWIQTSLKYAGKYGLIYLFNKLLKR